MLASVEAETLVLCRENPLFGIEHQSFLAERIPNATLVNLDSEDWSWRTAEDDLPPEFGPTLEFLTGSAAEPPGQALLVTMVFLDIVGSTPLAERLGDRAWAELLHSFTGGLHGLLRTQQGILVNSAGDGFLTRFDSVSHALRFARDIRHVAEEQGLHVRVGVHTGECQLDGDDLRGVEVHAAARIMALAEGSEVLVSEVTRTLAKKWMQFTPRGDHELRGIPGTWPLYRLES